jgi:extracellular factor (EF) 3-hydroxypalmitic acid methyl ester biosynthesis protein
VVRLGSARERALPSMPMKSNHKALAPQTAERDSIIVCQTSQSYTVRATPLRITRDVVAFEVYNPYSILQLSEVLNGFRIIVNDQLIYSGRATVSNLVNVGIMLVCEATLDEGWLDVDLFTLATQPKKLRADFMDFFKEWKRINVILPEYKVVLADIQNYFTDLNRWLEQVELGIRSSPYTNWRTTELEILHELAPAILPSIDSLFTRFEEIADKVPDDLLAFHKTYAKRQLHPQVLCSPFAYRTYHKPLGYAGDYETVNMILREPLEGSSMFAKTINLWLLGQPSAEAHRNRIKYLTGRLVKETQRVAQRDSIAQIFSIGCGPAGEVKDFLIQEELSNRARFTLLDFNEETLQHTAKVLAETKRQYRRSTEIETVKKSVHQILKDAGKQPCDQKYDFIYCAGLFDYLSDRVCKRLMNIMYDMLAPSGLLLATNVHASNPNRHSMDFFLEWHIVHRSRAQLAQLKPDLATKGSFCEKQESTGVNIFVEVRKPSEASHLE